jgi:hypothetical protein
MSNHTLKAGTGHFAMTGQPASFIVTSATQLPEAFKAKRVIVIDNPEMGNRFASVQAWQDAQYWVLGPLIAALLAFAIAQSYKIEISWHHDWKVKSSDGKIVLTPVERK